MMMANRFKVSLVAVALTVAACAAPQQSNVNTTANKDANAQTSSQASGAMSATDHANMNHGGTDHGAMSGQTMDHANMKSSPDAASAPYDLQFLDTMVAHHQGAVDMARPAVEKAEHADLKTFARNIITDQEREINQMKGWREQWYAGKPQAMNMEMRGMMDSMRGMDMSKLNAAIGKPYDLMFLEMMVPHHEGAITMSREALNRAEHPEIKRLAQQIIDAQEREIGMMNKWKGSWR